MRQVTVNERLTKVSEHEIRHEVREMKVRQENRLGCLKEQMRQSLMEVKETKARLFPSKENEDAPCLKDQVEKISTRIDRVL